MSRGLDKPPEGRHTVDTRGSQERLTLRGKKCSSSRGVDESREGLVLLDVAEGSYHVSDHTTLLPGVERVFRENIGGLLRSAGRAELSAPVHGTTPHPGDWVSQSGKRKKGAGLKRNRKKGPA